MRAHFPPVALGPCSGGRAMLPTPIHLVSEKAPRVRASRARRRSRLYRNIEQGTGQGKNLFAPTTTRPRALLKGDYSGASRLRRGDQVLRTGSIQRSGLAHLLEPFQSGNAEFSRAIEIKPDAAKTTTGGHT